MSTSNAARISALAHLLADRACVVDIEANCLPACADGRSWWDTRSLLDRNEQPDECIDMFAQALEYAAERNLFTRHPTQPHLVRINPRDDL